MAAFREVGNPKFTLGGPKWKVDTDLRQYNVDVWCAQQSTRKKWKARDWDVHEVPFDHAPSVLQRVLPEKYTELPVAADPSYGDYSNIDQKVFDIEELQDVLFPAPVGGSVAKTESDAAMPYPRLLRVRAKHDLPTLDSIL